jgi:hemerythrin superfamily protein
MKSTEHWLVHDHSHHERLLGDCMEAADIDDWWALDRAFTELVKILKHHMAQEEEVLFPAYESKPNASCKPTDSLRKEHDRIVFYLHALLNSIKERDHEKAMDALLSLQPIMIHHHETEEEVFLPMASHILFAEREQLSRDIEEYDSAVSPRDWGF